MPADTYYFDSNEEFVQWKMNDTLLKLIKGIKKQYAGVTIVCIGTDRSTGDSFGPLTGHMLSRLRTLNFKLYGTFREPVHALTLPQTLSKIDTEHMLVIAVDASVGSSDMIGYIGMSCTPVKPGSGLGKKLPAVGDISITGIAALGGISPFLMLQNASLGMVYNMAEKTYYAIQSALYRLSATRLSQPILEGSRSNQG